MVLVTDRQSMDLTVKPCMKQNAVPHVPLPLFGLLLIAVLLGLHEYFVFAPCDDAYIFLVYVRNFLEGNGLTYNGDYVQGFSSIAWPWVLISLGLVGIPLPSALTVASTLSGGVTLAVTYWAARKAGITQRTAILPAFLLACSSDFAFYASNGLETVSFSGLLLACAILVFEERNERTLSKLSTLCLVFLLPLLRPEGALFGVIIVLTIACAQRDLAGLVRLSIKLFACWAPVLLAIRYFYGHWLPATYYAKSGAGLSNLGFGIEYTTLFISYYWPVLIAIVVGLVIGKRPPARVMFVVLMIIGLWVAQVTIQGGDNMVGFRVYVPLLPLLYVFLAYLYQGAGLSWNAAGTALLGVYLFANYNFGSVIGSTWHLPVKQQSLDWSVSYYERERMGLWMREYLPAGSVTALNPAGITPYLSHLPTIDMLGLNNIHIAIHGKRDRTIPYGHQVGDGEYVLSLEPSAIWLSGTGASASQLLSDREIFQNPLFQQNYQPCQITAKSWLWVSKNLMPDILRRGGCMSALP